MTFTPVELVLFVARAMEGAGEAPPGSNSGPFVTRCQRTTGNKSGDPWCASWVTLVGKYALGAKWPVLASGGCQAISDWAVKKGVRLTPAEGPQRGDLLLVWYEKLHRYAHIAFVLEVHADGTVTTIDGNTTLPGDDDPARSREGWIVAVKRRTVHPKDRFVRWSGLVTN